MGINQSILNTSKKTNTVTTNTIRNNSYEIRKISKQLGTLPETSQFVNEIYESAKPILSAIVWGSLSLCAAIGDYTCKALRSKVFSN